MQDGKRRRLPIWIVGYCGFGKSHEEILALVSKPTSSRISSNLRDGETAISSRAFGVAIICLLPNRPWDIAFLVFGVIHR